MDIEILGKIAYLSWGMLFIINMILYLWTKSSLILFVGGFMLGGVFIQLIIMPHMIWQSKFIDKCRIRTLKSKKSTQT
ncbi:hypothetical protein LCGC14_2047710 [marine sediment metagenome]|uniref:Uncharacterized protein n=1 Tax=marine sediment metagenome TaxID=412755 RepID=A0A0F9EQ24_9ZZZZ